MKKVIVGVVIAALIGLVANPACSEPAAKTKLHRFFVSVQATQVGFSPHSNITVNGVAKPGAGLKNSETYGGLVQVGYNIDRHFAVVLGIGTPQTSTGRATGTIAAAGALGKGQFVPIIGNLVYVLPRVGIAHPFVGTGVVYAPETQVNGIFLHNFHVSDSVGPDVVAGVEIPVAPRIAINASYSKSFFNSRMTYDLPASFGGYPGTNGQRLNPSLLAIGLSFRL